MVSEALVKLSSPLARSCLMALGIALLIDAVLTFFAASQYPYLIAYTNELYIKDARSITFDYSAIGGAAILLAISTALASYKSSTNFVLVHACITGIFLPVALLVYFSSLTARYKVVDYQEDFKKMLTDFGVSTRQIKVETKPVEGAAAVAAAVTAATTGATTATSLGPGQDAHAGHEHSASAALVHHDQAPAPVMRELKLTSVIYLIDSIQSKFSCCGVESHQDWLKHWDNFLPPSCCSQPVSASNAQWESLFKMEAGHQFQHCPAEADVHRIGCLAALKEDEKSKFAWLSNLIVFLMVVTIANTILTLLLYGLSKTENMPDMDENELAMVGASSKPRPSQPEITGIRHRPSVVHTLGANKEQIAAISHAVRFNLANSSPRGSVSGPSKFSTAARRGSAFV